MILITQSHPYDPNELQLAHRLSLETNGLRVEINFFYNI
jgi:hypothetical protein